MKKFLVLFILLLFPAVLLGCFSTSEEEDDRVASVDEFVSGRFVGELKSLGLKTSSNATHLLEQQSGDIVYLYSNFYNLDSERFLGKKVEVRGTIFPGVQGEKDTVEVEKLTLVEEEGATESEELPRDEDEEIDEDGNVLEAQSSDEEEKEHDLEDVEPDDSGGGDEEDKKESNEEKNDENEKIVADEKVEDEEISVEAATSTSQEAVISYVTKNISAIAPEPSSTSYIVSALEFVEPNYVYVEYYDSDGRKKVLLTYMIEMASVESHTAVGYFVPGSDQDWETMDGSNPVSGKSRTVVTLSSSGSVDENFQVEQGYRYFESSSYHFKAQYPASWYFQGSSGHYGFSDKPVDLENERVSLDILGEDLDSISGKEHNFGSYKGKIEGDDIKVFYYIERKKGGVFRIQADRQYQDIVDVMSGSIVQD